MHFVSLKEAMNLLKLGHLVCLPTETVYGVFGSSAFSDVPNKIYEIKQRPKEKNLALYSLKFLNYWHSPEPITVIKEGQSFRLPSDPFWYEILQECDLWGTSANVSGCDSVSRAEDVKLDLAVLPGFCRFGFESTVYDLDKKEIKRQGILPLNVDFPFWWREQDSLLKEISFSYWQKSPEELLLKMQTSELSTLKESGSRSLPEETFLYKLLQQNLRKRIEKKI